MPFRFTLHALLRYRQSVERREEIHLQQENLKVTQIRSQIDTLQQFLASRQATRQQELRQGAYSAELQFELLGDAALRDRIQALSEELARREKVRDLQCQVLRQARMQREAVETIRDRQWHQYRQLQQRRLQRALDDLFLMRRKRQNPNDADSRTQNSFHTPDY